MCCFDSVKKRIEFHPTANAFFYYGELEKNKKNGAGRHLLTAAICHWLCLCCVCIVNDKICFCRAVPSMLHKL